MWIVEPLIWYVLVGAVILYRMTSFFSAGTPDPDFRWKILGIAIGSGGLQTYLTSLVPSPFGLLTGVVVSLGVIAGALILWCGLERPEALKTAYTYYGAVIAPGVALGHLQHYSR
jgi:hypothetical protein